MSTRQSLLHRRHRDGEPFGQCARGGAADDGADRQREAPWKHHAYQGCRRQAVHRVEAAAGSLAGVPRQEINLRRYPWRCVCTGTADDDNDGEVTDEELESCLRVLHDNKAP